MPAVSVLIVDDHRLVAEALTRILRTDPEIEVAGCAGTGPEALSLVRVLQPSLVLMDIGLPGMDGVETTWTLRHQFPQIPVLVLTMFDQEPYVLEALRAGASGYLLKTATAAELLEAVRAVSAGHRVMGIPLVPGAVQRVGSIRLAHRGPFPLSRRETQVVQRIVAGRSVREIASDLHLSAHTIRNHLKSVYRKLGVHSQTEVAVHALRRGIARA